MEDLIILAESSHAVISCQTQDSGFVAICVLMRYNILSSYLFLASHRIYRNARPNGDIGFIHSVNHEDHKLVISFDHKPITYDFDELDEVNSICSIYT